MVDVISSLGSAFNFGWSKRVQKLTRHSLPISTNKPLPGMKQLLLSAYAAHIKVSPRIHDIKESMLRNNLGHRLPAENTSSMFKQMERPMKHKPPQLGSEQRSSKQPRICIDATAPLPPALLKPFLRLCPDTRLEEGWGGKVEPGSGTTPQYKQLEAAERCPLKLEIAQGARGSRIEWGSLGLLLLCAGWHWLLRATEPAEPSVLALGTAGADSARLWVLRAESSPVGKGTALHHLQTCSLAKPGP